MPIETTSCVKEKLELTNEWDKTFKLSDKVEHNKDTFVNHFGITLAADIYKPKGAEGRLPAIAVCGPFGAVKEQSSGLYAHEMAKRGYLTLAFDPSFTGESGGMPRYMNSPDINTEDFMTAVDYLSNREDVDPERIGIIGICGWGGFALNTAAIDTRIKATAVMTMYDMSRVVCNGYNDSQDSKEARMEARRNLMAQRTKDFASNEFHTTGGLPAPEELPSEGVPESIRQYAEYYRTERGYHPRSLGSNMSWCETASTSLLNTRILRFADEIESAVLLVHGEKAHSRYMGETAFSLLKGDNKKKIIVPGAIHCDLYDRYEFIPFDSIQEFFGKYLS